MTELPPPETEISGVPTAPAAAIVAPALVVEAPTEKVGPKRQRRPSVRLGDIGDPQYDLQLNRRTKQWKLPMKSSKRGPMSFGGSSGNYHGEDEGIMDTTTAATLSWKARDSKSRRVSTSTAKRVRSSWMSKVDGGGGGAGAAGGVESGGEDVDDGFRDFEFEGSESPIKEQSPFNSLDNFDGDRGVHYQEHKRGAKARVSVELDGPSDTDGRNWNNNNNNSDRNGVREWLNQLGLGRYAPVFEIHEVDDEVLPLLTLEDLKDMGINAVGSRRKMYSSIQKLGKGFS